jgi:uncharacterized membrane protein HdeD (DUF308 family)
VEEGLFGADTPRVKRAADVLMFVVAGLLVAYGVALMMSGLDASRTALLMFGLTWVAAGIALGFQARRRVRDRERR